MKSASFALWSTEGGLQHGSVRRAQPVRVHAPGLSRRTAGGLPQCGSWPSCGRPSERRCWGPPWPSWKRCVPWWHARRLAGADKIGVRVGRVINKYKVAKHFELKIEKTSFSSRAPAQGQGGSRSRRHLCAAHAASAQHHGGGPSGAQLQVLGRGGARLSLLEDHRSEGAPHSPSAGRSRARAHLRVHARLLRRVAHARGLAQHSVRRRRSSGQSNAIRSPLPSARNTPSAKRTPTP